ncbi:MAG: hypothetical protein H8D26_00625, partial [Methanomicrobia archaeon]|nr:hypothetical protein [Methanomicrobia archaeon]
MKGHRILIPSAHLALIALGIFILFNTGHDDAITFIIFFVPATIVAAFLVRYLVT